MYGDVERNGKLIFQASGKYVDFCSLKRPENCTAGDNCTPAIFEM